MGRGRVVMVVVVVAGGEGWDCERTATQAN